MTVFGVCSKGDELPQPLMETKRLLEQLCVSHIPARFTLRRSVAVERRQEGRVVESRELGVSRSVIDLANGGFLERTFGEEGPDDGGRPVSAFRQWNGRTTSWRADRNTAIVDHGRPDRHPMMVLASGAYSGLSGDLLSRERPAAPSILSTVDGAEVLQRATVVGGETALCFSYPYRGDPALMVEVIILPEKGNVLKQWTICDRQGRPRQSYTVNEHVRMETAEGAIAWLPRKTEQCVYRYQRDMVERTRTSIELDAITPIDDTDERRLDIPLPSDAEIIDRILDMHLPRLDTGRIDFSNVEIGIGERVPVSSDMRAVAPASMLPSDEVRTSAEGSRRSWRTAMSVVLMLAGGVMILAGVGRRRRS
jgi:hypothetical protein